MKDPIVHSEVWHDLRINTMEGISCSEDFRHPFQIEGARWHFLKTLAGDRLGAELVPFISAESSLQGNIDTAELCTAWWEGVASPVLHCE